MCCTVLCYDEYPYESLVIWSLLHIDAAPVVHRFFCGFDRKVTGIFFENKVDYTTWFGDNVEFIHGIQVGRDIRCRSRSSVGC